MLHYQNFVNNRVETEAKITGFSYGEFADSVHYTYKVNRIEYTGDGLAGYGNPETKNLKIGDKVIVFYDSGNIKNSLLGNPKLLLDYQNRYTWVSAILGSALMIISILIARSSLNWIQQNGVQQSETI